MFFQCPKRDIKRDSQAVYSFLKKQNFAKTAKIFLEECESRQVEITLNPSERNEAEAHTGGDLQTNCISNEHSVKIVCRNFKDLQSEYRKLLGVTAELTNLVQLNITGQVENIDRVLDHCKAIYPSLFLNEEIEIFSQTTSPHHTTNNIVDEVEVQQIEQKCNSIPLLDFECLNFHQNDGNSLLDEERTPSTHREIKNILQSVLDKVTSFIFDQNAASMVESCREHIDDIAEILEWILIKVMESPRSTTISQINESAMNKLNSENHNIPKDQKEVQNHIQATNRCGEIKNVLLTSDFNIRLKTLETLTNEISDNLTNFISEDLLNLNNEKSIPETLFDLNSNSINDALKKLLNNLRNFPEGREYLEQNKKNSKLIETLDGAQTTIKTISETSASSIDAINSNSAKVEKIESGSKSKKVTSNKIFQVLPKVPICYNEVCRLGQRGNTSCKCIKCVPDQSRYYCGCYEEICNEIAEEMGEYFSERTNDRIDLFKRLQESKSETKIAEKCKPDKNCTFCKEAICACAFESRPKIQRTPPSHIKNKQKSEIKIL